MMTMMIMDDDDDDMDDDDDDIDCLTHVDCDLDDVRSSFPTIFSIQALSHTVASQIPTKWILKICVYTD